MKPSKNSTLNNQNKTKYLNFLMRQIQKVNKHIEDKKQHKLNIFSTISQLALF